jgi:hypothetical protein
VLGLPATVTVPGLVSWRKMRWLPRWRSNRQPSASGTRITSRTFTPDQGPRVAHRRPKSTERRPRPSMPVHALRGHQSRDREGRHARDGRWPTDRDLLHAAHAAQPSGVCVPDVSQLRQKRPDGVASARGGLRGRRRRREATNWVGGVRPASNFVWPPARTFGVARVRRLACRRVGVCLVRSMVP